MKIAVIPARGGSKRIPRKNVRPFAGRPIIAWPIACARDSGLFDRIIVSTDDPEIASIGREHGAEVPFMRPRDLADDHITTADVMAHAAAELARPYRGKSELCCIYATAALLEPAALIEAADVFATGKWDYIFAAQRFASPPQRGLVRNAMGAMVPWMPEHAPARSQDLETLFHDAGQFYWAATESWAAKQSIYGPRSTAILLLPWQACDIDTEEDWANAERLFIRG